MKIDEKFLRVTMPDGSKWDVPVKKIAENRARHYMKDPELGTVCGQKPLYTYISRRLGRCFEGQACVCQPTDDEVSHCGARHHLRI